MDNEIFKDRERANEAAYFRQQDAKLLDSLRARAPLDEIASAIGDKLQVDNPELLERVRQLGLKPETAPALLLAPLVQVAWAEGKITRDEQDVVLRLAQARGVEADSPPYQQILEWLAVRPSDATFDTAVEILKYGFAVLPEAEREDRIKRMVEACHEVASASGGGLARLLGLGSSVSEVEASMLDDITTTLRSAD
jgi:tellurite resistance protein